MSVWRSFLFRAAGAAMVTAVVAAPGISPAQPRSEPAAEAFRLRSSSFDNGETMPTLYTCDGSNTSPPLVWSDPPRPAGSFLIAFTDADADATGGARPKRPFVHWILYNVTGDVRSLNESVGRNRLPGVAREGTNDFRREGYDGPCPPPKAEAHRYVFTLYALDGALTLPAYPAWPEVEAAIASRVVATATLAVTYERTERR